MNGEDATTGTGQRVDAIHDRLVNFYCTRVRPRIKSLGRALGIKPTRSVPVREFPPDFDARTIRIVNSVNEYTMTSPERLQALIYAVRYIVTNEIPGDIVECGVWRGGSMMAAALTLTEMNAPQRGLYLYDTFDGMSAPTSEDGEVAKRKFKNRRLSEDSSDWCRSSYDEVRANLASTGYPAQSIHLVRGKVEETLPAQLPPGPVAILRLDTDWYQSTRHELEHLYPRLVRKGVLIIDDYDSWPGSRKAVDEYIAVHDLCLLLNRVDVAARIAIKP